jgi:hypothetical protein
MLALLSEERQIAAGEALVVDDVEPVVVGTAELTHPDISFLFLNINQLNWHRNKHFTYYLSSLRLVLAADPFTELKNWQTFVELLKVQATQPITN